MLSFVGQYVFDRTSCQAKLLRCRAMAKRAYTQRVRAETAEETRQRILDTLYERLREAPAEPISVDEVGRASCRERV